MDWESWPTGRPGPYVSEAKMQAVMNVFRIFEEGRNEESRTKENVMHIAEFSSSGQGEYGLSHRAPE